MANLNVFISERLTAAAVEIFGAVEKTLIEYQEEIRRSKQEIDHLRTLVLWPEVKLHRTAAHQISPQYCDKEASPESCHEEDWASDVSQDRPGTLHIKEEQDQQCDTTECTHFEKRRGHEKPPSHLLSILTVERTADIKAEPDGDELITSPSTREAEIRCGINLESSGLQQEILKDPQAISHHEQDGLDEQLYTEQVWSPCQDHQDLDPHQIKVEKFTSSSPQEDADHDYKPPPQSQISVHNESYFSRPSHDQTLTNKTCYTAEEKRKDVEGEGCQLPRLTRVCQPLNKVNQSEYDMENTGGMVKGEWIKAFTPTGTRQKKRHSSNLCSKKRDGIRAEADVNDLARERRHTCPICGKRFKESGHLKNHVRIHTGEKPYPCKECGMNFRQSGALTLHMRIHTGERPYQCIDCGRCFNRNGDMKNHRMTHTGERPHPCMVCGKSFKRKGSLNAHLKIHAEYTQPVSKT